MLTITVLGPKSPHTDKLESFARTAIRLVNPHTRDTEILRVTDETEINAHVNRVPSLMINGKVVAEGAIPAPQLIVTWLSDAIQSALEESLPAETLSAAAR